MKWRHSRNVARSSVQHYFPGGQHYMPAHTPGQQWLFIHVTWRALDQSRSRVSDSDITKQVIRLSKWLPDRLLWESCICPPEQPPLHWHVADRTVWFRLTCNAIVVMSTCDSRFILGPLTAWSGAAPSSSAGNYTFCTLSTHVTYLCCLFNTKVNVTTTTELRCQLCFVFMFCWSIICMYDVLTNTKLNSSDCWHLESLLKTQPCIQWFFCQR